MRFMDPDGMGILDFIKGVGIGAFNGVVNTAKGLAQMADPSPVSDFKMGIASTIANPKQAFNNVKQSVSNTIQEVKNDKTGEKLGEVVGNVGVQIGLAVATTKGLNALSEVGPAVDAAVAATDVAVPATDAAGTAVDVVTDTKAYSPNFIVDSSGQTFPVPNGATGPTPVINQAGNQTGVAFTGGTAGENGQVSTVRIMDPVPARGSSPGYTNGYIKYTNARGQGVDPTTGRTIPKTEGHYELK